MENIVNYRTYVKTINDFLKMNIVVNKGTDRDNLLEKLIELCNQFNELSSKRELTDDDVKLIRVSLKRFNMLLKITDTKTPVNIRDKNSQLRILEFEPHPSILDGNLKNFLTHLSGNNIELFAGIPLNFILRETKYRDLIWQYTRSLFFITQIILTNSGTDSNKRNMNEQYLDRYTESLEIITMLDEKLNLEKLVAMDEFLKNKVMKSGINDKTISSASEEVKELFSKKGISGNNAMGRMVDSISNKLKDLDLSNGNLIQTMMSIAQDVAGEMQNEVQENPDSFKDTLGSVMEIFNDTMNTEGESTVPDELRGMFASVKTMIGNQLSGDSDQTTDVELLNALEPIAAAQGKTTDELLTELIGSDGQLDEQKFMQLMTKN